MKNGTSFTVPQSLVPKTEKSNRIIKNKQ